jgi:hypothetical protein
MISIRTDSYNQANQLIAALAEADIEAGITEGGVTLRVTPDQIPLSSQIAASYGLTLTAGNAIPMGGGWEECFSNKGEALLEEWLA